MRGSGNHEVFPFPYIGNGNGNGCKYAVQSDLSVNRTSVTGTVAQLTARLGGKPPLERKKRKMNTNRFQASEKYGFEGYINNMTTSVFASLPAAYPEYFFGPPFNNHRPGGGLLLRIHPSCNRPEGDEDVLARALVVMPEATKSFDGFDDPAHLRRLTIRERHIEHDYQAMAGCQDDKGFMWPHFQERVEMYRLCLEKILCLEAVDLSVPSALRTAWPVVQ